MERIGFLAAAFENAEHFGAARDGVIVVLEHERRRALGENEAIAIFGKRLGGLRRWIVLRRQGREQRKANQRFRCQRAVGAERERRLTLAALDRLDPELDRGGARSASRGQRDRRTFSAEM